MPVLNPTAAGIDIGATEIYVAVHPDCDPEPVRSYATFTKDLPTLRAVVDHYDQALATALTEDQKNDLVAYLRTL
jgi:hypothetical protein